MKNKIYLKLRIAYPFATDKWCETTADALMNVVPALQPNLIEWLTNRPYTLVRIHGRYTLGDVLSFWGGTLDAANALLALDAYARDPGCEEALFPEEVF